MLPNGRVDQLKLDLKIVRKENLSTTAFAKKLQ